ncbi:type III effector protein [Streptomyces sp. NPDC006289]|uniref:type III effector protein n=1 Tax=Streptomyces sp. NPDC006289 TaxID=3156744 RepID=UPI0033AF9D9D
MNPSPTTGRPDVDAATTALARIAYVVAATRTPPPGSHQEDQQSHAELAMTALRLLRELRDELAGWESGLIEAARASGTSWADLAQPLGVSSRQAAEKRYLRVRPGAPGATGEQRVEATRSVRAADRTVTTWARSNAADLRQLAGQITALSDLPATPGARISAALADDDAANLIAPLTDAHKHLTTNHPGLAARIDSINQHTDHLRQDSHNQRTTP